MVVALLELGCEKCDHYNQIAGKIEEAVSFRNILAHRYGDVNHNVVYDVLHTDLSWFECFQ